MGSYARSCWRRSREARQTQAYRDGAVQLRGTITADEAGHDGGGWGDTESIPPFGEAYDIEPIVAMVVGNGVKQGTDPRLVPPVSVAAARRRPDYGAPHGWKAAMTKEVRRVEGFNAWELVRFSEYWKVQRAYPNRVRVDVQGGPKWGSQGARRDQQIPHIDVGGHEGKYRR